MPIVMNDKIILFEKKIREAIGAVLHQEEPDTLFAPVRYILSIGGKRVRPLLTLLAADMFGADPEIALEPALAVEIFHNFSLLHDDLMDHADLRRGMPTVHCKWNVNSAILSGDAMMIESYRHVTKVPSHLLPQVLDVFSNMAMDICKGQQYDMDFESRLDVTEADYLEMIRLKTAVLLGSALKIGAIVAKASPHDAELLYDYGVHIGLAFQLKDDLLDVYGDPLTFGKKIGGDILANKKTFLLIKALSKADEVQRAALERWITATDYDPDEKINFVKNIYDQLNLRPIAENLIEKYYLASLDLLSSVGVADNRKKDLRQLSEKLMYREK
ncbi:MAG: Trans-Isoprenyl Diphosphate Synthase [Proteiniphilum sp.]|nr:Trans-Isoprenyl Diphosphate Synthase [Proteiniphilum sp.]